MSAADPIDAGSRDDAGPTMRALAQDRYGSARDLELRLVPRPAADQLAEGQILVRVVAASLNALDHHFMTGVPYMMRPAVGLWRPPPVRGADLAGVVEATGPGVDELEVGDRVFGTARGSLADYAVAEAACLCPSPDGMSDAEAAAIPVAGITALEAVRDHGGTRAGDRVLVIGAAGGVGTYAVQIAVALGAEVAGVCSARNVDLVSALGATEVIDYTAVDPVEAAELAGPFDVIVDNVGTWPLGRCGRLLAGGGVYVMVSGPKRRVLGPVGRILAGLIRFRLARRRFKVFVASESTEELADLARMFGAGQLQPVIERCYRLDEAIEAIEHLATGHARAKLVIDVAGDGTGDPARGIEVPERARIDGVAGGPLP